MWAALLTGTTMETPNAKTLNGKPTSVAQLNVLSDTPDLGKSGLWAKFSNFFNKANLVLAGMYTGVTCYGVPHEEHGFSEGEQEEKLKKTTDGE
ncbi:MAG: hypothetical protein AB8B95_07810 [Pseudohongiellaceae bacterium]